MDENGGLDIDQGMVAVKTAREFAVDNTDAVTKDLSGRMVAAVVIIVASGIALLAGLIILIKAGKE